MFFYRCLFFVCSFLLCARLSHAVEIKGYVRSVNHEGHSFSVDIPPLQRVWVFPSTRFDSGMGYEAFKSIKDGDYVSVEGVRQSKGLFTAKEVKLLKSLETRESERNVDLNQTFLLEVNQKAKVKGEELTLLAVEMIDNLCKEGLNCEGEGSIGMRFVLSKGREKKEIFLSSTEGRKPLKPLVAEALGYRVELIELGEYAALLVVRK